MHLTPEILERAYDLLRSSRPFKKWSLPPADEVEFHVNRHRDGRYGDHQFKDGRHVIRVSDIAHKNMTQLMQTMAHEMAHMQQRRTETDARPSAAHGPKFFRLIRQVGRVWGWAPEAI